MVTNLGMKRIKTALLKFGQKDDPEVNEVLQAAIIGLNRLTIARGGTVGKPVPAESGTKSK